MQPSLFLEYYKRPGLALITGAILVTILTLRKLKDVEHNLMLSPASGGACEGRLSKTSSNAAWMGDNWEQLRELTLKQMILPGSHNSGNTLGELLVTNPVCAKDYRYQEYLAHGGTRSQEEFDARFISWNVNHFDSIPAQLQSGVRFFHLKLCWLKDAGDPAMTLAQVVHQHRGYTAMSFDTILDQFVDFLEQHPKEVLLVGLNNMHQFKSEDELQQLMDMVVRKLLPMQLIEPKHLLSSSLEELVQSNRRVGVFIDCDHPGAIKSSKHFVEDWGPEMHGGDLQKSLQWLKKQVLEGQGEPSKFVVLQANPNNAEPNMYAIIESQDVVPEGTSLFHWQKDFLRKLRPLINEWSRNRGEGLALNVISTDFMEHSELVELVLRDLMQLPS